MVDGAGRDVGWVCMAPAGAAGASNVPGSIAVSFQFACSSGFAVALSEALCGVLVCAIATVHVLFAHHSCA